MRVCEHECTIPLIIPFSPRALGKIYASTHRYKKGGAQNSQLLMPHVYHLVDQTYSQMMTEQKSQSILISGESGAGKTEAMKIALTYIGEISNQPGGKDKKQEADPVADRLMQTNPVMEAIGARAVAPSTALVASHTHTHARARCLCTHAYSALVHTHTHTHTPVRLTRTPSA